MQALSPSKKAAVLLVCAIGAAATSRFVFRSSMTTEMPYAVALEALRSGRLGAEDEKLAVGVVRRGILDGLLRLHGSQCEHAAAALDAIRQAVR